MDSHVCKERFCVFPSPEVWLEYILTRRQAVLLTDSRRHQGFLLALGFLARGDEILNPGPGKP